MTESQPKPQTVADDKKVHGVVAEFTDVDSLLAACRRVRDAGYTKADAFTPFPVHGIDTALGIKPTVLPWIALAAGLTGTTIALLMQISLNGQTDLFEGIQYPYIISGKPFISLPAFIPVTFELTILLASFGTFFGMWALNGLPRFSNPMFTSPRFDRATDDTFFLFLDAKDSRFDEAGAKALLGELGGEFIEPVLEDDSSKVIPKGLLIALATVIFLSAIPALSVLRMRVTKSGSPRFHIFPDMDFSPSKDAQQTTTLFADGRAMRPDVPGTVRRGEMDWDLNFKTGIDMDELASIDAPRAAQLVAMQSDVAVDDEDEVAADETAEEDAAETPEPVAAEATDNTPWLTENPLELSEAALARGQQQFNIYCSVCHGMNGRGNGLVNRRAQKILATTWTPPSNMHDPTLYADVYPDGKLFSTITNGVRKMPGYASQIKAKDRWAIVAYVRALQTSQNATLEEVPDSQRSKIEKEQAEVQAKLKAAAEAEAAKAAEAAEAE
ncbi:MAG: quinol:electron acceptor oxidoreductase subunit ActD [Rhodopirellula sp. JB055]|uniref:quinol:electron acceptor oxidoreductase subunit ActD n=1 Tax=Rhodopirellula sp. JB055 TaxID=3342846 RepID=UPI003709D119